MCTETKPSRTLSSDSMTLRSMSQYDQMDAEIRTQIQSNIHALYEPAVAPMMHIVTCRGNDGAYLAFLVKQDCLAKALSNPSSLASEPKSTRSAAMLSLLEATEQQIAQILINTNNNHRTNTKKSTSTVSSTTSTASTTEPKIIRMPTENVSTDYGERPKEKGFMPWKKHLRTESSYARSVFT